MRQFPNLPIVIEDLVLSVIGSEVLLDEQGGNRSGPFAAESGILHIDAQGDARVVLRREGDED